MLGYASVTCSTRGILGLHVVLGYARATCSTRGMLGLHVVLGVF